MVDAPDAMKIIERLKDMYGEPERKSSGDPVAGLVGTILSQNTSDTNSRRAFAALRDEFDAWDDVLEASTEQVADAIRQGGLANQKAATIQRALRIVREIDRDFDPTMFDNMSDADLMSLLTDIKGVGQKTAACVLMFDLERDVLPVDTHVHRVSRRIGFAPDTATANQTQEHLETLVPPTERYAAHVLFIRHGRTICNARAPKCDCCNLSDLCEFALQSNKESA